MPLDNQSPDDRWTKVMHELDNLPAGLQGSEREAELLGELDRLEYEAGLEHIGRGQRTTGLLVAIREAGYHVGWAKFWQLRTGDLVSMVSARDAKTGEKWVVHARSEHEATVELARRLGVNPDGYEACRDGRRV